jgi:hypothetical protein
VPTDRPVADKLDPYATIVAEARAQVAAGKAPDAARLAARIRAVSAPDERAAQRALGQLERVVAVHRARTLVAREPAGPAAPAAAPTPGPSLRSALRTKPTITGNLDVRRERHAETYALSWDGLPAVVGWEVRLSERPDARSDYRELETLELPPASTTVELPLADRPFRVNILGRGRDGRLVRRALISGLTGDAWDERWQRRASAS